MTLYQYFATESVFTSFLGMVTAMDEQIGKIINDLKNTGHYDNSVIVFTTDVSKYDNS